jgi:ribosomally synthesized peptide (two-chain TOMM family)
MSGTQKHGGQEVSEFTTAVTAGAEDPVKGIDTQLTWQLVWLEAISLAWRDPVFKRELLADPQAALLKYFKLNLGPHVKLTVREASPPDPKAIPKSGLERAFGGWDPFNDPLKSEVIMALPHAPKLEDQAVALALYNSEGRASPFSTCC